jgi:hypothetical protein
MKIISSIAFIACVVFSHGPCLADEHDLMILGWVENAQLSDPGLNLKAKLDTGAETSSLDARIVKKFRKSGKRWVRFGVTDRDSGEEFVFVRERVRTIGIVQHDGTRQTRPVVSMSICIAGHSLETEVSLIDRSEFNYPLLLGRSALASIALVDPGSTFLAQSRCAMKTEGTDAS